MTRFYEIRIEGHLDDQWADWFDGLSITQEEDGTTLLAGPVSDQPALHGLLRKVRDLGLPLVAVQRATGALTPHDTTYTRSNGSMNANNNYKLDTKVLLSTLWIVVMFNMLKADILSLYIPGSAEGVAEMSASTGAPIPQLMLVAAIIMAMQIFMIILARVLRYGVNRWANIIVSLITIAYIVLGRASYPHYTFIAAVEIICLLAIIGLAWRWRAPESRGREAAYTLATGD